MSIIRKILIVVFLLIASSVWGVDHYVSTTGSGTWANSTYINTPCSITTALANATAGDTVYFRGGTYTGHNKTLAHSGTSGSPITLINYPDETPVFDGGITGTGSGWLPVFDINNRRYITFSGLEITRGSKAGIGLGYNQITGNVTSNIIIEYCYIHDIKISDNTASVYIASSGGVNITTAAIIVRYNTLNTNPNCLELAPEDQPSKYTGSGVQIFETSGDIVVDNNEIYNAAMGVHYKHGRPNDQGLTTTTYIRNNLIHDVDVGIRSSSDSVYIQNNLVYDTVFAGCPVGRLGGIYTYHEDASCNAVGSYNNLISHNTVISKNPFKSDAPSATCSTRGLKTSTIQNNIFYADFTYDTGLIKDWYSVYRGSGDTGNAYDYNIIYNNTGSNWFSKYEAAYTWTTWRSLANCGESRDQACNYEVHGLNIAPTFIDYANDNFVLTAESAGYHAASDGADMGANIALVGTGVTYYTVTPSAGAGGSINPATPQSIISGQTKQFTVTPSEGYSISSITGTCGGEGTTTYITNAITADCTVIASFVASGTIANTILGTGTPNAIIGTGTANAIIGGM